MRHGLFCLLALAAATAFPARAALPEKLPQTRPCAAEDLDGLRKLRKVYEQPEGAAMKDLKDHPHQYMFFGKGQTIVDLSGKKHYKNPVKLDEALRTRMRQQVNQYVLGEKGVLYVYVNSQPTDSYYCMIATKPEGLFRRNDMILMKTDKDKGTELIRLYHKPHFKKVAKRAKNPMTKAQIKKAKKKRAKQISPQFKKKAKGKKRR